MSGVSGSEGASTNGKQMDRVYIFDTTLRDGEQSPGARMNTRREARESPTACATGRGHHRGGIPDHLARRLRGGRGRSREQVEGPVICGLARAAERHRPRLGSAVKHAERPRIHTFIATCDIHIEHKLHRRREE